MEQVPGAPAKPPGFVSLVDCRGIPNDDKDDTAAFDKCLSASKNIFIPEGVFTLTTKELSVPGVTIRGSGVWRSTLKGVFARFDCDKSGCKFYDFMMDGDTNHRDDSAPETAFTGNGVSGTVIEHIWVEHKRIGVWPGDNTNGLTIRNSRFRDLFADGVNLACGTSNALVEHVHARNTGDDAFAAWSLNKCGWNHDNTFKNVYAQLPSGGGCGILAQGPGAADMANVTVAGASAPLCNEKGFDFIEGVGNSGW